MSEAQTHTGSAQLAEPANQLAVGKEMKFSFKKQFEKDAQGNPVLDELGQQKKRAPVFLTVPIPTFAGLVDILGKDEKVQQLIVDLAEEAIKDQVRTLLADDEKPVNRQSDLDLNKLTLSYIANLPKSERTGGGIAKETWEDWEKDYIAIMGPIRNSDEKAAKAAKLMLGRFNTCRTDKPVLKFLQEQLAQWASETSNLEDYQDVYKYLDDRATDLINRDSSNTLDAL